MRRIIVLAIATLGAASAGNCAFARSASDQRGEHVFAACGACHSLEADRHMTGPSLADLWNRQAGSLQSFER